MPTKAIGERIEAALHSLRRLPANQSADSKEDK
jgi:hypothetical protein